MERGLLEMRYEGKAQVFTVRDDFKRRLAERYGVLVFAKSRYCPV